MRTFEDKGPAAEDDRVLEIGCAPGRWMVFYAERFGARVEGLEYTEFGVQQTRANLRACGVEGIVHHDDFWSFDPTAPYDLVLSIGFIEHFADVDGAFDRHLAFVRPGGRLVLALPNFQGLNGILATWLDASWVGAHNLEAMGHDRYLRLATAKGIGVESVDYVGGFDPEIMTTQTWLRRKVLAVPWHLRHLGIIRDRPNAWWFSSHLVMVFSKPRDE